MMCLCGAELAWLDGFCGACGQPAALSVASARTLGRADWVVERNADTGAVEYVVTCVKCATVRRLDIGLLTGEVAAADLVADFEFHERTNSKCLGDINHRTDVRHDNLDRRMTQVESSLAEILRLLRGQSSS